MVTGPDEQGFQTVHVVGGPQLMESSSWQPIEIDEIDTGEVTIEPMSEEDAREEHGELLTFLRDAVKAGDLKDIQGASKALSLLERQFPVLAPENDRVTERDN